MSKPVLTLEDEPKLSDRQRKLLTELCTAEPGRGYMLKPEARRVAGPLISAGHVMWLGFGKIRVYSVTEKGRSLAARLRAIPSPADERRHP